MKQQLTKRPITARLLSASTTKVAPSTTNCQTRRCGGGCRRQPMAASGQTIHAKRPRGLPPAAVCSCGLWPRPPKAATFGCTHLWPQHRLFSTYLEKKYLLTHSIQIRTTSPSPNLLATSLGVFMVCAAMAVRVARVGPARACGPHSECFHFFHADNRRLICSARLILSNFFASLASSTALDVFARAVTPIDDETLLALGMRTGTSPSDRATTPLVFGMRNGTSPFHSSEHLSTIICRSGMTCSSTIECMYALIYMHMTKGVVFRGSVASEYRGMPADSFVPKGRFLDVFFATYLESYWLSTRNAITPNRPILELDHRIGPCKRPPEAREVYQIVCDSVWWWRCVTTDVGRMWRPCAASGLQLRCKSGFAAHCTHVVSKLVTTYWALFSDLLTPSRRCFFGQPARRQPCTAKSAWSRRCRIEPRHRGGQPVGRFFGRHRAVSMASLDDVASRIVAARRVLFIAKRSGMVCHDDDNDGMNFVICLFEAPTTKSIRSRVIRYGATTNGEVYQISRMRFVWRRTKSIRSRVVCHDDDVVLCVD